MRKVCWLEGWFLHRMNELRHCQKQVSFLSNEQFFFAIFSVSRVSWCHKSCQQDFLEGSRMAYVRIFSSCEDLDWILGIFDEQLILDCVIVWYHPFVYQSTNLTEKNLINNSGCHVIHHNRAIKRVTRVVVVRESITMNWLAMWFYQSVGFPPLHHNFPKYFLV